MQRAVVQDRAQSTLLNPAAAPAHLSWAAAAWPAPVAASVRSATAEPQASWLPDEHYLSELAAANNKLQQRPLPGGATFHPVHPSCPLLPLCETYGVPAAAVALGAWSFQCLLDNSDELRRRAVQAGFFSIGTSGQVVMHASPNSPPVLAILCTCIHLGTQLIKGPRYDSQLQSMLSHATGEVATHEQASELEMRCLQKLHGRLGP